MVDLARLCGVLRRAHPGSSWRSAAAGTSTCSSPPAAGAAASAAWCAASLRAFASLVCLLLPARHPRFRFFAEPAPGGCCSCIVLGAPWCAASSESATTIAARGGPMTWLGTSFAPPERVSAVCLRRSLAPRLPRPPCRPHGAAQRTRAHRRCAPAPAAAAAPALRASPRVPHTPCTVTLLSGRLRRRFRRIAAGKAADERPLLFPLAVSRRLLRRRFRRLPRQPGACARPPGAPGRRALRTPAWR